MRQRCENPNHTSYHRYGGRGISVCERWHNFRTFVADMGPKPSPAYQIERENNERNYEPGNCIWETQRAQSRNRQDNLNITFDGRTMNLADWAKELGVSYSILYSRYKRTGEIL